MQLVETYTYDKALKPVLGNNSLKWSFILFYERNSKGGHTHTHTLKAVSRKLIWPTSIPNYPPILLQDRFGGACMCSHWIKWK